MTDYKNCISYSVLCAIDSFRTGTPCFCRCDGRPEYECPNFKRNPS